MFFAEAQRVTFFLKKMLTSPFWCAILLLRKGFHVFLPFMLCGKKQVIVWWLAFCILFALSLKLHTRRIKLAPSLHCGGASFFIHFF